MLRFNISTLLTLVFLGLGQFSVSAVEIIKPKGVVELFTSQGCSSCPPADAVLGKLAKERDVLVLGWHVDYWDYLGWKDSFASPANTERQRRYARSLKERNIYTPQAIINGQSHVVGSRERNIRKLLDKQSASGEGLTVPINAFVVGDSLAIDIPASSASNNATLWLVYFNNSSEVAIGRGENSGRSIVYHNVVRDMQMLGMVKTGALKVELPMSEMKRQGFESCGLLLQTVDREGNPGRIVGAAIVSDL